MTKLDEIGSNYGRKAMKKNLRIYVVLLISILATSLILPQYIKAQTDEKSKLLNSTFGDFRQAKKIKKHGKESLKVWEPHIQYSKTLPSLMQGAMLKGVMKLPIEYDEIWTWENDEGLTPAEKKRFKGQNDIYKLYWKQNKVQACTIEKYYVGDPFTGQKLSKPSHKIWNIYDRDYILKKLSEK